MHDGSLKTLEEVVEHYDKGGIPNPSLDQDMKPLKLTAQESADLVAFMKALTGEHKSSRNCCRPFRLAQTASLPTRGGLDDPRQEGGRGLPPDRKR